MDANTLGGGPAASNLLGMPETSFRGLSTRTARSVRRSTWVLKCVPAVARMLWADRERAELSWAKTSATPVPRPMFSRQAGGSHKENYVPGQVQRFDASQSPHASKPRLMPAPKLMGHCSQPKPPRGYPALAAPHLCPPHARMAGDSPKLQRWPSPMPCSRTLGSQHCRRHAHHSCVGLTSLPGRWHIDHR